MSFNSIHRNESGKATRQAGWREFSHLIFAGLFGCLAIALVALASSFLGEPAAVFTREPQEVLKGPFYVGSFSNLGGLVWFGAAAIMSFAGSLKPLDRGALILAASVTWAMGTTWTTPTIWTRRSRAWNRARTAAEAAYRRSG